MNEGYFKTYNWYIFLCIKCSRLENMYRVMLYQIFIKLCQYGENFQLFSPLATEISGRRNV